MFVSHKIFMENRNNSRLHGRLRNLLTTLTFGGLLAGCDATASDKAKTPIRPEPAKVSLEECTVKQDQAELLACFEQLSRQNQSEIAVRNERIENKTTENADLDEKIAKGNTTVEVLSKDIEEIEKRIEERVLEPER